MAIDHRDLIPVGNKPSGVMSGRIFRDQQNHIWYGKRTDNGCFLRYHAEPGSFGRIQGRFGFNESTDDHIYQNISAIWETLFTELAAVIMPDNAPECLAYEVPRIDGGPYLIFCSKGIEGFKDIKHWVIEKEDFNDKQVNGLGKVFAASIFLGDPDISNIQNIGLVKNTNGSFEAKRIDFGLAGWFSNWGEFGFKNPDLVSYAESYNAKNFQLPSRFKDTGLPMFPFANSHIDEQETTKTLKQISEIDPAKFAAIWQKWKPHLQKQCSQLMPEVKSKIGKLIDYDMPMVILQERQQAIKNHFSKAPANYSNCTLYEDHLAYQRATSQRRHLTLTDRAKQESLEQSPQERI